MDADSRSTRLSSASKRYQSALQTRSGQLNFVNFPVFQCFVLDEETKRVFGCYIRLAKDIQSSNGDRLFFNLMGNFS